MQLSSNCPNGTRMEVLEKRPINPVLDVERWPEDDDFEFKRPLEPTVGYRDGKLVETFVVVSRYVADKAKSEQNKCSETPNLEPRADIDAFKACFSDGHAYSDYIASLPCRPQATFIADSADAAFLEEVQETDSERSQRLQDISTLVPEALRPLLQFVGRPSATLFVEILSDAANRTLPIVEKLLRIALPCYCDKSKPCFHNDGQGYFEKRARKVLARIAGSKAGSLPQNSLDLAAWSELNEVETASAAEDIRIGEQVKLKSKRRTPRHFKNCKQCGGRFLPKRASQEFHTDKCKLRWNRKNRRNRETESPDLIREIVQTPLEPANSLAI